MRYSLLLFFSSFILLSSCRKDIEHTPGEQLASSNWTKVDINQIQHITAVEVHNDALFIAGHTNYNQSPKVLKYQSGIEELSGYYDEINSPSSYNDPIILDLESINGKLYVAGNFDYSGNGITAKSLYSIDINNTYEHIPLLGHNASYAYNINSYNGDLIVSGDFGTYEPLVNSSAVERIQNGVPIGLDHLNGPIAKSIVYNNELFVVGEDENKIRNWTGTTWGQIDHYQSTNSDEIYSISVLNNEIFICGEFDNNVILKSRDEFGVWSNHAQFTCSGSYKSRLKTKTVNNKTYFFGSNIYDSNELETIIYVRLNNSWQPVGTLQNITINDLAVYNGILYAATSTGLFRMLEPE